MRGEEVDGSKNRCKETWKQLTLIFAVVFGSFSPGDKSKFSIWLVKDPWDWYILPRTLDFHGINEGKYTIHGSYWLHFIMAKPFTNPSRLAMQIPSPKLRFFWTSCGGSWLDDPWIFRIPDPTNGRQSHGGPNGLCKDRTISLCGFDPMGFIIVKPSTIWEDIFLPFFQPPKKQI